MIDSGAQARSLAAMIVAGVLDPERPLVTFRWEQFLAECRQRLVGDAEKVQERLQDIEGRVRQDLKQMTEGWRPHLPSALSVEEWEAAEVLARQLIEAKPHTIRRRGSAEDVIAVLRFVAIKAQGRSLKLTQERAVRHLGWVDWDLEEKAPAVQAARRRLERVLAWMTEGTDKQATLNLAPLLRRVHKGCSYSASGHCAPSKYEALWENWGGAFVGRADATQGAKRGDRAFPSRAGSQVRQIREILQEESKQVAAL
jgi:hypothetical protein